MQPILRPQALDKFQRFQELGLDWLIPSLKRNIQTMQEMITKLEEPAEVKA